MIAPRLPVVLAALSVVAASLDACSHTTYPWRVPNSPYPGPSSGSNGLSAVITTFNGTLVSSTQLLTLQTLQGVLARTSGGLFQTGAPGDTKNWWLSDLVSRFPGVSVDDSLQGDFSGLLTRFRPSIAGYVLANVPDDVSGALSYAAAADNVIVVTPADVATLRSLGIPQVADATSGSITPQSVLSKYPLGRGVLSNRTVNLQVTIRRRENCTLVVVENLEISCCVPTHRTPPSTIACPIGLCLGECCLSLTRVAGCPASCHSKC
jgi:hypothetical protein